MDEQTGTRGERTNLHGASERIAADVDELRDAVLQRTEELRDTVSEFVQEHPYVAVGAAFAAGYVISGALVSRTTGRVFGFGLRFLVGALVKQALGGGGLGLLADLGGEGPRSRASRARM